ncbi:MAG: hypothetical protein HY927_15510 [Elusimicrobia bacterium]|nr:hypothetical protein [Elusimicrobiota bacterium]
MKTLRALRLSLAGQTGRRRWTAVPGGAKSSPLAARGWPLLDRGWIIANHKLVSFHAAFLTSLLSISKDIASRGDVLRQMFLSWELVVSTAVWYAAWHINIAIHEMGHYLAAVKTNNLRPELAGPALKKLAAPAAEKWRWYAEMFLKIPFGQYKGVTKEAGSFHPSVKSQNLAVSAAGPAASRLLGWATLPLGTALIALGLFLGPAISLPETLSALSIYVGRFFFTVGVVAMLDFLIADPGKYAAFHERQDEAALKKAGAKSVGRDSKCKWSPVQPAELKRKLEVHRLQEIELPDGTIVFAPWEFRNSIMGGRHTEEMGGNLSFQELMFLPFSAKDYIEAQRITNALQTRVIQIIQDSEGLNFVGIGLEGGVVASYTREECDILPEERALRVAVQAIEECGFVPDRDVVLALDPAASELSKAYREQTGENDAVGQYLFWRAEDPKVMSTEELVLLYKRWVKEYPIVSLEDAFAEDDHEGWKMLMKELGKDILIIGDDLVTTKDTNIIRAAEAGLINTALIKANQIGTLSETLLATKAAKDKGLALVVSHRSKSPNEVMEADIGFAVGALGLKCGGGSNTERLIKYGRIVELIELAKKGSRVTKSLGGDLVIADITAHEEPTNAGIPTVGVIIRLDNGMKFSAATPLGTSAGEDEAIHLTDSIIEAGPLTRKYPALFKQRGKEQNFRFDGDVKADTISSLKDDELAGVWMRAKRYEGKGCLNAVGNVEEILAPRFLGKRISQIGTLADIDRTLLEAELELAVKRGKIPRTASDQDKIKVMQRKANLGMNAILSMSLAFGRLLAAKDGRELPDLLKELESRIDRDILYGVKKPAEVAQSGQA